MPTGSSSSPPRASRAAAAAATTVPRHRAPAARWPCSWRRPPPNPEPFPEDVMTLRRVSRTVRTLLVFAVASLQGRGARADGLASEFPATFSKPQGIIAGPDGNVWFTEEDGDRVTRISPTGTFVASTSLSTGGPPANLAVGMDGNVWVTDPGAHKLAR